MSSEIYFEDEVSGWVRYDLRGRPERVKYWLSIGLGNPIAEEQTVVWRAGHLPDDQARVGLLVSVLDAIFF